MENFQKITVASGNLVRLKTLNETVNLNLASFKFNLVKFLRPNY